MLQTAYTHTKTRLNLTPWRFWNSPHLLTVFEMNEALMSRQGVTAIHAFHEEAKWFFLKMLSDKLVCSCQHDMKDTHYKQLELQTRPPWYHIPHSWPHAAWENQECPFICLNEAHCIIARKSFKNKKETPSILYKYTKKGLHWEGWIKHITQGCIEALYTVT